MTARKPNNSSHCRLLGFPNLPEASLNHQSATIGSRSPVKYTAFLREITPSNEGISASRSSNLTDPPERVRAAVIDTARLPAPLSLAASMGGGATAARIVESVSVACVREVRSWANQSVFCGSPQPIIREQLFPGVPQNLRASESLRGPCGHGRRLPNLPTERASLNARRSIGSPGSANRVPPPSRSSSRRFSTDLMRGAA